MKMVRLVKTLSKISHPQCLFCVKLNFQATNVYRLGTFVVVHKEDPPPDHMQIGHVQFRPKGIAFEM